MCNNDASHVIVQWAIWMSGNIGKCIKSVPLITCSKLSFWFHADIGGKTVLREVLHAQYKDLK